MSSPSDSLRALPRYTPSPRRNKPDAARGRLLGRRLRQLLVVVGAVGVLARRDARVLVVLLVRRRRVGGVVFRLGLGAVLLDHGREELLFLAFVLLEERRHARDLGLVVVPVEAREAVAVHLLEGFVVRRHDGLSAPRRLRLARLARGTALRCTLSMRPSAMGIGHGSVSCRRRGEIAVCLVLPRVQFRQPLRALRGLAGGAVVVRRSCANQFRRVRPAGPCLRASELHSGWGVGVRKNLLGFRSPWRKEF